ncbi:MAG: GNAT family N-acetyltransferase [Candidatus Omnitrophica bacterium]|nr:GNAT family N-acetyltransferase [Candidatus Omnitrophota bacterium]MDD5671268.1 GNAT family N-acetyltransferase [Candidatus Omnitrophota bacterium]
MSHPIQFFSVSDAESIGRVETLAGRIWREHYTPIIGEAQVEYMLEKFQSRQAISKQIGQGNLYYLVRDARGEDMGYLGVVPRAKELFLSKVYLTAEHRGKGYGRQALAFIEKLAKEKKLGKMTLTVNKHNGEAIRAYQRAGFKIVEAVLTDIGNGFAMDDYKMEKAVP